MTAFPYHRAVAPMMWVLVSIACVELAVVHLLVGLWSRRVAMLLSLVSLAGVVWLIGAIRSFRSLPVLLDDDLLILRTGRLHRIAVPLANVKGLRRDWDAAALKRRSVAKLSLIAWPNVVIDLHEPVAYRSRRIGTVAHRLDDPEAFARAGRRSSARNPVRLKSRV